MISIIVPVLNEENKIYKLIKSIEKIKEEKEVIFVDGGSKDKTTAICERHGTLIKSPPGRAFQMNEGAKLAKGEILWFVHADSILSPHSIKSIEAAISCGYEAGGFSIYFYDDKSLFMKYISISSNLRAKYMGLIFGDQGIFVKKESFFKLGGYPKVELMEDWILSKLLCKRLKTILLKTPIGSSARRFQKGGKLRTHLLMHRIKIMFMLGVDTKTLNKVYRRENK